ncbi:Mitochondrial distribution and morphology protein family 31/32 fungi [Macrophomina phaseolina MS6]|uniref:Mitochondrial distribution and morphology protein family 31/32 fungi n=1 Tax=Macrophomina phaseolina (strain MS6) TaxID=1126212 RepID=K2RQF4_MACPH|nr:Mitochondrial distribution and morphology protein family 31/32 fungi [Macrophomina phaseolina MS6]
MSRHVAARVGGRTLLSIVDLPMRLTSSSSAARLLRDTLPVPVSFARHFSQRAHPALPQSLSTPSHSPSLTTTSLLGLGCASRALTTAPRRPQAGGIVLQSATTGWKRSAHTTARRRRGVLNRRNKSSSSNGANSRTSTHVAPPKPETSKPPQSEKIVGSANANAGAGAGKHFMDRLPHLPHRPTKEELLAAANGAWSRFKVHFKWFSIKSGRKFNMDDISAFFSWILLGHLAWVIVGTTTFFSMCIFLVNTVVAQETLARWVGNYLTKSSGVRVVFESAIIPKWGDGVITFKNVFVSRRPGQGQGNVSKGSQDSAAAAAAAAVAREYGSDDLTTGEDDGNYSQFDLTINTVNVTLSFTKWFNGKGLLRDVEIKGIRGVVDRTHLIPPDEPVDPRSYKHEHNPGDFELDSFKMEDLLVTVYQPDGFRPFPVSIYQCDLPQLRKQWLFYDFLSANNMSGSIDNSLFTIHPRQTHNYADGHLADASDGGLTQWKKHSRMRIDGLNIDHLNRGVDGPFGWIHEGNVDIVADIMFPADNEDGIAKVMSDFYDRMEATVAATGNRIGGDFHREVSRELDKEDTPEKEQDLNEDDKRFLVMDMRVQFNDVRAAVPLFTNDISYVNNALIRPIVAYINSKRTFIPVNCRVVKRASEFDGSWTIYDSGLMDDLSRELYEAFARDINDDHQMRARRFKKVGIWTLQLAAQALFLGLAGNIA